MCREDKLAYRVMAKGECAERMIFARNPEEAAIEYAHDRCFSMCTIKVKLPGGSEMSIYEVKESADRLGYGASLIMRSRCSHD